MKKGFTLVEMLIVVVVLVTLMTIAFRLSSIGSEQTYRNRTISRMQRVENCLSGYYAAFGSYPPVALHGSRNIYAAVNEYGIQSDDQQDLDIWGKSEEEAWEQVKAACKSQPVDCRYPFPSASAYNELVKSVSESLKKKSQTKSLSESRKKVLSQGFDNGVTDNIGRHDATEANWRQSQLFKFGLMSYLLPRYLVMMYSEEQLYNSNYAQWNSNNTIPCDALTGTRFSSWAQLRDCVMKQDKNPQEYARVANVPSQAVTARWMPNLAGIVCCNHDYKFYGVDIRGDDNHSSLRSDNFDIEVFQPGGYEGGGGQAYVLDGVTILDGWYHEFYYYSPAPFQSYTLWSAGPNGKTFPPWISRKKLTAEANERVAKWIVDDIVRMSN